MNHDAQLVYDLGDNGEWIKWINGVNGLEYMAGKNFIRIVGGKLDKVEYYCGSGKKQKEAQLLGEMNRLGVKWQMVMSIFISFMDHASFSTSYSFSFTSSPHCCIKKKK